MKHRLLTSVIAALSLIGAGAQPQSVHTPKLVVGITIDQLRADYLEAFAELYGSDGFNRLLREGRVYCNTTHNFAHPDRASAIAAIYTGTSPYYHGIIGTEWLDEASAKKVHCADDNNYRGVYSNDNTSPKNLLVSTLSDELKMATVGQGLVYALAPEREMAVFAAGHAADVAIWINDETGNWGGTTFYKSYPTWISTYNDREGLRTRLADTPWEPLLDNKVYSALTQATGGFKHRFLDYYRRFREYKTSGLVNEEVNRMALRCLEQGGLGSDNIPDLLSVTYYAGNFEHKSSIEYPQEIQDTYARLDRNIAALLTAAEQKVGRENLLVFVTSTGYVDPEKSDYLLRYHIPTGEFYMDRCTALLNMYLMASFGQGQYVSGYDGLQIYFDHRLIERKALNLVDVLAKASEFLSQFNGVKAAYTTQALLIGAVTPEAIRIRNGYHVGRSGDIVIEVMPGWKQMEQPQNSDTHLFSITRASALEFPLIFWGGNVAAERVHTPVTTECIAPTVAHYMRIRAPNACSATALTDVMK